MADTKLTLSWFQHQCQRCLSLIRHNLLGGDCPFDDSTHPPVLMDSTPVILVPGVAGWGSSSNYWGQATSTDVNTHGLRIQKATVGPVSSNHDRACELFAQLKGCLVDYGNAHATECDHQRFGKDFTGSALHPGWNESKPIHLVAHSSGVPTARMLQHLLAEDFWGLGTNSRWVRSITSLAGNINGTSLPYLFGVDETTGRATRDKWLEMYSRLRHAVKWVMKKKKVEADERTEILDWSLGHWGVSSCDENIEENIAESKLFSNDDHILFETTVQGSWGLNKKMVDYDGTYYFSFVTLCTNLKNNSPISWSTNPLFMMPSGFMLHNKFDQAPVPDFEMSSKWNENDGFLLEASQTYPLSSEFAGAFVEGASFRPGVWYSTRIKDLLQSEQTWDHLDVCWGLNFLKPVRLQHSGKSQAHFYEIIFETLSRLS